jgi:AbrB family looped-hinge helix DNA binding protein
MDVKVNNRGQIVIPIEMRKKYGIKAGTQIAFIDEGEYIRLQPLTPEYVHSLRGKYRGKGLLKALMVDRQREREL